MIFFNLLKVLWQPTDALRQFIERPNLKPLILVVLLALLFTLNPYIRQIELIINEPSRLPIVFLIVFVSLIKIPFLCTLFILIPTKLSSSRKVDLVLLIGLFLLCALPSYIESIMVAFFGYTGIGLGSLVPLELRLAHPFWFGIYGNIQPFFIWTVVLWWIAIKQLLNLPRKQHVLLISSLIIFNLLLSGLLSGPLCQDN